MFLHKDGLINHMKRTPILNNIKIMFDREPWWAEFWSAAASIGWSIISIVSYEPLSNRPVMAVLTSIAGPNVWEVFGIFLGFFQFAALMTGCTFGRRSAAFVCGWWWFFLTIAITMQDPSAPSIALYAVFGAINIFSMLKLARRYA